VSPATDRSSAVSIREAIASAIGSREKPGGLRDQDECDRVRVFNPRGEQSSVTPIQLTWSVRNYTLDLQEKMQLMGVNHLSELAKSRG
jgi:hypothetical protein